MTYWNEDQPSKNLSAREIRPYLKDDQYGEELKNRSRKWTEPVERNFVKSTDKRGDDE